MINYRDMLLESVPDIKPDDVFFRRALKDRFSKNEILGRTAYGRIGKEIAQTLNLSNPARYTGHCFRRSAATEAANNGATTTDLKTGMGWENDKTALQYIERTKNQKRRMSTLLTGINVSDPAPPPAKIPAISSASAPEEKEPQAAQRISLAPQEKICLKKEGSDLTMYREMGQKIYKMDLNGAEHFTINFS